ncbi:conserved hypothetical protein [Ricinus communis]|uniref:DUF8040 domain-containing protein n=1 Tax=Ricinus communis TaxID=3988 RepID=B9RMU0_RICCO|nr:conserved hypothetical protein [Ricinus communis]
MDRGVFYKLCEMLENIGGLKPTRNMLVDEQVGLFSHHLKNKTILTNFERPGETIGFGKKVVIAEPEVWAFYLESHKKATPFMTRSLWYFEEFTMIYGKDHATGKDAQGVEDILEKI